MPVLRGTAYLSTKQKGYLWTKGFIPRLDTYPGWEVPNPLLIEIHRGEADLLRVMTDVMGLTKINFNTCQFADGQPVTLKFADAVGEILTAAFSSIPTILLAVSVKYWTSSGLRGRSRMARSR